MIKSFISWLLLLAGLLIFISCKKQAAQRVKTPEEINRDTEIRAIVNEGKRISELFLEMPPLFAKMKDPRSLKKAERDLNILGRRIKNVNREIRLLPIPDRSMKIEIRQQLQQEFATIRENILQAMQKVESVPPDIQLEANQVMNNFLNGDHGTGKIIQDYFSPALKGNRAPHPKLAEMRETQKNAHIPAGEPQINGDLEPIAAPEEPVRLPAQIVDDE